MAADLPLPQALQIATEVYRRMRDGAQPPLPLRPQDVALLDRCEPFFFGADRDRKGWAVGEGPTILLIHGWGGLGVQMAPLALALAEQGFRCMFFDAGGHGASAPAPFGFDCLMDDAAALQHFVGRMPPFAWVGHSAGALAMMAGRHSHGIEAQQYISIAAPYYPYVPIERLRRHAGLPEAVLDRVQDLVAAQFGRSWSALAVGAAWTRGPARLMVAYDDEDDTVRPADGDAILAHWPDAVLVRTQGCGHNRILRSEPVIAAIADQLLSTA